MELIVHHFLIFNFVLFSNIPTDLALLVSRLTLITNDAIPMHYPMTEHPEHPLCPSRGRQIQYCGFGMTDFQTEIAGRWVMTGKGCMIIMRAACLRSE